MGRRGLEWLGPQAKAEQRFSTQGKRNKDNRGSSFCFYHLLFAKHCPTCYLCHLTFPTLSHCSDKETKAQRGKGIDSRSNHKGVSNGSQIQGHSCLVPKRRQRTEVRYVNAGAAKKEMSCGIWSLPHPQNMLLCVLAQGHC